MQYELPHFRIDRTDFLKGSNSYDNYPDGGFQFSYDSYNAFAKPGWLANTPGLGSTVTSSLPTTAAFQFGYGKGLIAQQVIAVGTNSNNDGYFYTVSGSGAFTLVGSADTSNDYQPGKSWTVFYHGSFYTTSNSDITKNSYDLSTRDTSWWVTTKGQTSLDSFSPHPQVVFGDIHYIADGRYIHQDDGGTVQYNVFDLGQDWMITEMAVYNNLIYIAAEPYYNYSALNGGFSKIFTWNGYADSWIDEWPIGPRINSMYVFKNVLYVWTPNFVNYWNGSTLKPIYPMSSSSFSNIRFPYSSGIAATEDSMYFGDMQTLVRFGAVYPGGPLRFHRFARTADNYISAVGLVTTTAISVCTNGTTNGSNFLMYPNGTPAGNYTFKLNRRKFSRPVKIRGYVIYTNGMASGQYVEMNYMDEKNTVHATKRFGYAASTLMQGKTSWRFDVNGEKATTAFDPYITLAGDVYVEAIDVLYEPSESKLNS